MPDRALVFAGGEALPTSVRTALPSDALVVAADSGVDHALALGRHVDVAVGDFDSVTAEGLRRVEAEGARIERHAPDKDATDLELALDTAVAAGASHVTVVGGHGGRLDHLLGNLALLASPRFVVLMLDAWIGTARVTTVRHDASIVGEPGSLVSLLAMHGPAHGVTTRDLRFPLHDAVLEPGSTLGVSNELVGPDAGVSVVGGVLLAIQPDALDGGP